MLPNEPVQAPPVDLRAEVGPSLIDARWVDFAQVPQSIIERKPEPAVHATRRAAGVGVHRVRSDGGHYRCSVSRRVL
jgi:hypothetical protein